MSFQNAVKASRLIETIENYSVSTNTEQDIDIAVNITENVYHSDEEFWTELFKDPEKSWNKKVSFSNTTIINWVARLPGLYWLKESKQYRNNLESDVEERNDGWVAFTPPTKSMKVMGGIGTFLLPPDDEGKVIMTLSQSRDASMGIPVLVSPEVIEHSNVKEGDRLIIKDAYWRKMSVSWANRFPSIKGIPRGYLVINNPKQIEVNGKNAPVEFHPCTIMEYQSEDALLYDYVFCTANSHYPDYRKRMEEFFSAYSKRNGRQGRYLLAADINDPLFDAAYTSPNDLLKVEADGRAQISLITERIRKAFFYKD
ncbi:MAG TPA: hypothetical protein VM888_11595, partial [Chitinophagaceae bacterium]|nr:hypothetical protein [Chitinophagaceae bacterium]